MKQAGGAAVRLFFRDWIIAGMTKDQVCAKI